MKLYHVTTSEAAAAIEREGFRGDMWLSYAPLDPEPANLPPGRRYDACLVVEVPRALADRHEWVVPVPSAAREVSEWWCIPAAELNALNLRGTEVTA